MGHIMNGRSVSMEVKRDLRPTVIVSTLTYASETWAWNESQEFRVQAVEVNYYLRSAYGVSRMDGMSKESVYEHFGMCHVGEGKKYGVVEEVKQMLKWFGHTERMEEGKMARRVYVNEIAGGNVRGRPPVKWRDRVQGFVRERGEGSLRNIEQAKGECQNRERWKLFFCGHHLVGAPRSRRQNKLN